MSRFSNIKNEQCFEQAKPMTLGSAQFGLHYGITNQNGQVSKCKSIEIIRTAISEGVECIDTAMAYGESESIIGEALSGNWANHVKIITKLLPNSDWSNLDSVNLKMHVRSLFLNSCMKLGRTKIDTLMLHRAAHLNNADIMNEIKTIRDEGLINKIGVSIQNPSELSNSLNKDFISIIQMPYNILDYRWDEVIKKLECLKKDKDITIHVRSALLQGLLCSRIENHWQKAGILNYNEILSWLDNKTIEYSKASVSDLCISYVNSHSWVDSVIIGVDEKENLYSNLSAISAPLLCSDALVEIRKTRPKILENSLDPSSWS